MFRTPILSIILIITMTFPLSSPSYQVLIEQIAKKFFACSPNSIHYIPLKSGFASPAVLKVEYLGKNYIVKLLENSDPGAKEISWTLHADKLGIGPKVYYIDPQKAFIIIEYIPGNSLNKQNFTKELLKDIAGSLYKLHNSALQDTHSIDLFPHIYQKYTQLGPVNKLQNLLQEAFKIVKSLEKYIRHIATQQTPCHNDLNPRNILIKNNKAVFIDWGDSALANPLYDIATFFVLNNSDISQEKYFLTAYNPDLLQNPGIEYFELLKKLVYFEFALNLLFYIKDKYPQMLDTEPAQDIQVEDYINHFADLTDTTPVDILVYNLAVGSLLKVI